MRMAAQIDLLGFGYRFIGVVYMTMGRNETDTIDIEWNVLVQYWKIQNHLIDLTIAIAFDRKDDVLVFVKKSDHFLRVIA